MLIDMETASTWQRLSAVLDKCRATAELQPDDGHRACSNIRQLQNLERTIQDEVDQEIVRARAQGASWAQIPYGRSRQASQQRHAAATERLARRNPG